MDDHSTKPQFPVLVNPFSAKNDLGYNSNMSKIMLKKWNIVSNSTTMIKLLYALKSFGAALGKLYTYALT